MEIISTIINGKWIFPWNIIINIVTLIIYCVINWIIISNPTGIIIAIKIII